MPAMPLDIRLPRRTLSSSPLHKSPLDVRLPRYTLGICIILLSLLSAHALDSSPFQKLQHRPSGLHAHVTQAVVDAHSSLAGLVQDVSNCFSENNLYFPKTAHHFHRPGTLHQPLSLGAGGNSSDFEAVEKAPSVADGTSAKLKSHEGEKRKRGEEEEEGGGWETGEAGVIESSGIVGTIRSSRSSSSATMRIDSSSSAIFRADSHSNSDGSTSRNSNKGVPGSIQAEMGSRRQLQAASNIPPSNLLRLVLPPIAPEANKSQFIILAPDRTRRPDPLNNFNYYTGGWDFFSADYWASLAWTAMYGAVLGVVWVIFGLGFLLVLLVICLCFRSRWRSLRDRSGKYSKKQLTLPLIFMLFGVMLECVGLVLMIAGAIRFTDSAQNFASAAKDEVNQVASIIRQVTPIIQNISDPQGPLSPYLDASVRGRLQDAAGTAEKIASEAVEKSTSAQTKINTALNILQDVLFVIGCVTVGAVILGLLFTLCGWVVMSNLLTVIIWILCLLTWILVTVFLFIWFFGGDTTEALDEIAASPTDLSKFNILVPCIDPQTLENLQSLIGFSAYTVVVLLNTTISQNEPLLFPAIGAPGGICNPFGPAPNYTYHKNTCNSSCSPNELNCTSTTLSLHALSQRISSLNCTSLNQLTCQALQSLPESIRNDFVSSDNLVTAVEDVIPPLTQAMQCAYITRLVKRISENLHDMESSAMLLWLGFLFVSLGAVFFAVCAPIYAYRVVRTQVLPHTSSEMPPMAVSSKRTFNGTQQYSSDNGATLHTSSMIAFDDSNPDGPSDSGSSGLTADHPSGSNNIGSNGLHSFHHSGGSSIGGSSGPQGSHAAHGTPWSTGQHESGGHTQPASGDHVGHNF